jgi:hypothetical protein
MYTGGRLGSGEGQVVSLTASLLSLKEVWFIETGMDKAKKPTEH